MFRLPWRCGNYIQVTWIILFTIWINLNSEWTLEFKLLWLLWTNSLSPDLIPDIVVGVGCVVLATCLPSRLRNQLEVLTCHAGLRNACWTSIVYASDGLEFPGFGYHSRLVNHVSWCKLHVFTCVAEAKLFCLNKTTDIRVSWLLIMRSRVRFPALQPF